MNNETSKTEMTPVQRTVRLFESHTLRHVRKTIEFEMLEAVKAGVKFTQAHLGQLELLQAVGEELYNRNALLNPPPFVDICHEDGIRYAITVRVF